MMPQPANTPLSLGKSEGEGSACKQQLRTLPVLTLLSYAYDLPPPPIFFSVCVIMHVNM